MTSPASLLRSRRDTRSVFLAQFVSAGAFFGIVPSLSSDFCGRRGAIKRFSFETASDGFTVSQFMQLGEEIKGTR